MLRKVLDISLLTLVITGLLVGLLAAFQAPVALAAGPDWGGNGPGGGGNGPGDGIALPPLSQAEAEGLLAAIEEEYTAMRLYQSVLDTFGDVYPFNVIADSEENHLHALLRQAEKYSVAVPEMPELDLPTFESLEDACAAGVKAEIADAELYDDLMAFTTHTDLLRVYTRLQEASLESHLPAFEACDCLAR